MVTCLTNSMDGGEGGEFDIGGGGSVKQNIKERGGSDHFTFTSGPRGTFTSIYFFRCRELQDP